MILKENRTAQYSYKIVEHHRVLMPYQDEKSFQVEKGYARNLSKILSELELAIEDDAVPATLEKFVVMGDLKNHEVLGAKLSVREMKQEKEWREKIKEDLIGDGIELSPWIYDDHFCFRFIKGSNPKDIDSRVAAIEKTARIRYRVADRASKSSDWLEGHRGSGGGDNPMEDKTYGFDPCSRKWCDDILIDMGYMLDQSEDLHINGAIEGYTNEYC